MAVFLQYFSTFVAGYVIAFIYSWKLALVVASVLPVLAFLSAVVAKVRPQRTCHLLWLEWQGFMHLCGGIPLKFPLFHGGSYPSNSLRPPRYLNPI